MNLISIVFPNWISDFATIDEDLKIKSEEFSNLERLIAAFKVSSKIELMKDTTAEFVQRTYVVPRITHVSDAEIKKGDIIIFSVKGGSPFHPLYVSNVYEALNNDIINIFKTVVGTPVPEKYTSAIYKTKPDITIDDLVKDYEVDIHNILKHIPKPVLTAKLGLSIYEEEDNEDIKTDPKILDIQWQVEQIIEKAKEYSLKTFIVHPFNQSMSDFALAKFSHLETGRLLDFTKERSITCGKITAF